jgi:hypothetical protein
LDQGGMPLTVEGIYFIPIYAGRKTVIKSFGEIIGKSNCYQINAQFHALFFSQG